MCVFFPLQGCLREAALQNLSRTRALALGAAARMSAAAQVNGFRCLALQQPVSRFCVSNYTDVSSTRGECSEASRSSGPRSTHKEIRVRVALVISICFEGSNQRQRPCCLKTLSSAFHFLPRASFFLFFSLLLAASAVTSLRAACEALLLCVQQIVSTGSASLFQ